MRDSDWAWKRWAERDPYFAVLTHERYRQQHLDPAAKDAFLRSGEKDVAHMEATIRGHIDPDFSPRRALDFGCGVGRLLLPLAERCEQVVGVDIAPGMLAEAERNCRARGIDNVTLARCDDALSQLSGRFDFIVSLIVLQHIPPSRGLAIVRRLLARLAPAGVAVLQLTYRIPGSWLHRVGKWLHHHAPLAYDVPVYAAKALRRRPPEPPMQMNAYDLNSVTRCFQDARMLRVVAELTDHAGHHGVMYYAMSPLGEAAAPGGDDAP
jgi:2-polyprenyl-3-methyl-5-hydroxy-6-metoxy-1,4-benzoquinol methylase